VNNIAKHSNADRVHCSLRKTEGTIELTIEDNGKGFDMKDILYENGSKRGLGLASMKNRAEMSGGSFVVESIRGVGTTVRASWCVQK
jgi:signal transduction histidine kinase